LEEERLLSDKQKLQQAELLKTRADDLVKVFSTFFFSDLKLNIFVFYN